MYRRRLLVVACATLTGCTSAAYRTSGPRTPPRAPATDEAPSTLDPVESRAQAVISPLNEAYRLLRDPLVTMAVDDVSPADFSQAESSLVAARQAANTFSEVVSAPPEEYQALPTLVDAHEHLFSAVETSLDLVATLSSLDAERVENPADRLQPIRGSVRTLSTTADELRAIADSEPTVPTALFLTLDRLQTMTTTLSEQSTALGRLLDVTRNDLSGDVDWRAGVMAFEQERAAVAQSRFTDARTHYRDATSLLAADVGTAGSFADLTDQRDCSVRASLDAVQTALDAAQTAADGDREAAEALLDSAVATRSRCGDTSNRDVSFSRDDV